MNIHRSENISFLIFVGFPNKFVYKIRLGKLFVGFQNVLKSLAIRWLRLIVLYRKDSILA